MTSPQPLNCEQIQVMVEQAFPPESTVAVDTDGYYFNIKVISDSFQGLRPVARQQMVYKGLQDAITKGFLHAVNIATYTPEQWLQISKQ